MAKLGSWSVKGVDAEARQSARDAAKAAGLTIGAWIDRAILQASANPGTAIPPQEEAHSTQEEDAESAKPEMGEAEINETWADSGDDAPVDTASRNEPDAQSIRERIKHIAGPAEDGPQAGSFDAGEFDPAAIGGARVPMAAPAHVEDSYGIPLFRYLIGGTIALALLGAGVWTFLWLAQPAGPYRTATGGQGKEALEKSVPAEASEDKQQAKAKTAAVGSAESGGALRSGRDSATKIDRLRLSAQRGNLIAQYDLGLLLIAGIDVERDHKEAALWLEKAALQGFDKAQYNLGVLYDKGLGVKSDPTLAFFWYHSAAEQGHALAQHNLGAAYANGRGVGKSYKDAHK